MPTAGQKSCVLIVDGSVDSREVLRTALQLRGVETLEASSARDGIALTHSHAPDVIILDLESLDCDGSDSCHDFGDHRGEASLVVLGTIQRSVAKSPGTEFVSKPYHYGPLVRRIEGLLQKTHREGQSGREAA